MRALCLIAMILFSLKLTADEVWKNTGAQGSSIKIELSNLPVEVDNKVQIMVTIRSPIGYEVDKDKIRNQLLNFIGFGPSPFTLLSEETAFIEAQTIKITYTLDPEIAGDHLLTFGKIVFEPKKKESETEKPIEIMTGVFKVPVILKTDMIEYQGVPAKVLPLSIKFPIDISPINKEKFIDDSKIAMQQLTEAKKIQSAKEKATLAVLLCMLIATIVLLRIYWNKLWKPSKGQIRKQIARTAAEHALDDLNELKEQHYPETGEYEKYYNSLTSIVRKFLEDAYDIHASRLTTVEFLQYAALNPVLDEESKKLLEEFLSNADLVKFAQIPSSTNECEDSFKQAVSFIKSLPKNKT